MHFFWFILGLMASVTFVGILSELVPLGILPQMTEGLGIEQSEVGFLVGGIVGILIGAGLYAAVYPKLKNRILTIGDFGDKTLIDVLPVRNPWTVILPLVAVIVLLLFVLEKAGL